jgi:hypothetical protein
MKKSNNVLFREYLDVQDDSANVIAFKEAGDELIEFVKRGEKYSWYESFLRPICCMYRHYLELELKYWLAEFKIKTFSKNERHDLRCLWGKLKPLIHPFCETEIEAKYLDDIEIIILTFHEYDSTGQEFRYTRTIKNEKTLKKIPSKVNIESIKDSIAKVKAFFDGVSGVISSGRES